MSDTGKRTAPFVVLAAGLVILIFLLLPAVRGWLSRIPFIWEVLYPLLTVFAGYLVVSSIRAGESVAVVIKWGLLLVGALGVTIYTYGGAAMFFTVGRWSAILFIAAEVLHTVVGATMSGAEAHPVEAE